MQIEIPKEAEPHLKALAAQAGFGDDVQRYVLHRSLGNDLDEDMIEALRNDPRIARRVQEGLDSGSAGELTEEDLVDGAAKNTESPEQWSVRLRAFAARHEPTGHPVDDTRESIYPDRV